MGSEDQHIYAMNIFIEMDNQECADFVREILGPISTPLHDACARENTKVASFLIDKAGFDVNCEDDEGKTPVFRAAQAEKDGMIRWLFRHYQVRYLSRDDWSQLPENTTVRRTYREKVEMSLRGPLDLLSSELQEDANIKQRQQQALKALEDSQYCPKPEVEGESSLQESLELERNSFSFLRLCATTMRKVISGGSM